MSTRKDWNRLAGFIGKPGYEILCAHHLDMAGEGIWDPDIAPGDMVRVVIPYEIWRDVRKGMLVSWYNASDTSNRIEARILSNEGRVECWDHHWRLEKD
jgi:hypothetical protein